MYCPNCKKFHLPFNQNNQDKQKYELSQQDLRSKFSSLNFPTLESFKQKMNEEIESIQQQKNQIQAALQQEEITQEQKKILIDQLDELMDSYKKDYEIFTENMYKNFKSTIIQQIQKLKKAQQERNAKIQGLHKQLAPIIKLQKLSTPIEQLLETTTAAWMKKPLDMKTLTSFKSAQKPLDISLNQNHKLIINKVVDNNGKIFQGKIVLKSHTCDSIKQPKKLKSLPPLLMFDQKKQDSIPTGKLLSVSMQVNQFEDSNGKLIFPTEPIQAVQKVTCDMTPQTLKQFKAWKWDDLNEEWIETGPLQVSQDGKELKYEIQPKTKEEMIKVFQNIGQIKKSANKSLIFNASTIKEISYILKEASNAYTIEQNQQKIRHQIKLQEYHLKTESIVRKQEIQALQQYSKELNKMTQEIKKSKKSLFYDKVCNYFISKQDLVQDKQDKGNETKQELIFIPKQLRNFSMEYLYQSLINLNKKCFSYKQQKIFIKPEQYSSYLNSEKFKQGEIFTSQLQSQCIRSFYVQSPNKKFLQKYIFIHPKMKFFTGDHLLQQINKQVDTEKILVKINQDTMFNLRKKLQKWSSKLGNQQKKPDLWSSILNYLNQIKNTQYPLHKIYEQDSMTISQLIIQSKLQRIKLISTNKYLLKLQLAILYSLPKDKIIEFQTKIRSKYTNLQKLKNSFTQTNKKIGYPPYFYPPKQKFLQQYVQYFKLLTQQNQQAIQQILQSHVKNNIQVSQHLLMKQISNPEVVQFLSETQKVFDQATAKGLFDLKESNKMKQQKINKIKNLYLSNQQWNLNQPLIQRIIKEFFPDFSFISLNYNELIKKMEKYHETRSMLSSKQDIEKFKSQFIQKYFQYLSKQSKGLPGGNPGTDAGSFFRQISRTYGPQAARKSMGNISNIDCLTKLTAEQMNEYRQKAAKFSIESKQNLPQNLKRSQNQIKDYIKNVNTSSRMQSVPVNRSIQQSHFQTTKNQAENNQRAHKKVLEDVLGVSNSPNNANSLRNNERLNNAFKSKLPQQKMSKPNIQQKSKQNKNGPNKQNKKPQKIQKAIEDATKALNNLSSNVDQIDQQIEDLFKNQQNSTNNPDNQRKITENLAPQIDRVKEQLKKSDSQIQKEKQKNAQIKRERLQAFRNNTKNRQQRKKLIQTQFQQNQTLTQQSKSQLLTNASKSLQQLLAQKFTQKKC